MTRHTLKSWPRFFWPVWGGIKPFELRKDDRQFAVGDDIELREYDPDRDQFSGQRWSGVITYIIRPDDGVPGLEPGYCILGLGDEPD